MFQGPEADPAKTSSRVLKPPGGATSNIFGSPEEVSSPFKTHRMASNIFGELGEPQNFPKRTNPPGGKESGIFEDSKPSPPRHLTNPPGGKASNIFGTPRPTTVVKTHPNKPKDHIMLSEGRDAQPKVIEVQKPQVDDGSEKGELEKESTKDSGPKADNHEPRLGPRPRSHNKVLNPPGGKSSIAFY